MQKKQFCHGLAGGKDEVGICFSMIRNLTARGSWHSFFSLMLILGCLVTVSTDSTNETARNITVVSVGGEPPSVLDSTLRTQLSTFGGLPESTRAALTEPRWMQSFLSKRKTALPASLGVKILNSQNGPVLTGTFLLHLDVFFIYYGNWTNMLREKLVLENFVRSLSDLWVEGPGIGAPTAKNWWKIVSRYWYISSFPPSPMFVNPRVRLAGTMMDYYSMGKSLKVGDISTIVGNSLLSLPRNYRPGAVYFLLTSSDVSVAGHCTKFCGFHGFIPNASIVYSFVGHPGACSNRLACQPQRTSPNGNVMVDGMVNVLAHELAETATNPFGNAWTAMVWDWNQLTYVRREAGDLCNWDYGLRKKTGTDLRGNVYQYNMVGVGRMRFMVQQMWDPVKNACKQQLLLK